MSRALAQVKFRDRTIKFGIYNGTVDIYWFELFDSSKEAWAAWDYYYQRPVSNDKYHQLCLPFLDLESVEIANNYGGGETSYGIATKNYILTIDPYKMKKKYTSIPNWWVQ